MSDWQAWISDSQRLELDDHDRSVKLSWLARVRRHYRVLAIARTLGASTAPRRTAIELANDPEFVPVSDEAFYKIVTASTEAEFTRAVFAANQRTR